MAKETKWGSTYKVLLDVGFIANAFVLDTSEMDGFAELDGSTDFVDITVCDKHQYQSWPCNPTRYVPFIKLHHCR